MDTKLAPIEAALRSRLAERYRTVDGRRLTRALQLAVRWLATNEALVNSLNVYPVPDSDTGTNMLLTLQAAMNEHASLDERSIGKVMQAVAHGALMGARGNSGVILSQLMRGFARALDKRDVMDAALFVAALAEARDTAYKGVVRPVEGTILTVSKDIAAAAEAALQEGVSSILDILERVVEEADRSVERTPELLPEHKRAGVVDAGGKGLFVLLQGMLRAIYGQSLDQPLAAVRPLSELAYQMAHDAAEPGQDWEVVVDFRPDGALDVQSFYARLEQMGTSIQVGEGDGMYRMHIHVPDNTQYEPIDFVRGLGTVTKVAIENLMVQMAEQAEARRTGGARLAPVEPGQIAAVVVAPGSGIARVFASLGAAAIVEGGQTMNPSTKDILAAFEDLPSDKVVILPNNSNILLAAKQVAELTVKKVRVIPTISVAQGVAAMMALDRDGDLEKVAEAMHASLGGVRTLELTRAARTIEVGGVSCREGQMIGLVDDRLTVSEDSLEQALLAALPEAGADQAELITFYYGSDLTPQEANRLADRVRSAFPSAEIELVEGGQPHYPLILSIE
jgi:hypothetical protein